MPKLILICGTSFSGKSTLASRIADRFGFSEVDVDETKAALFGADLPDKALGQEDWDRIYRDTDQQIADHLGAGQSVIDASRNFSRGERDAAREICQEFGADHVTVFVDTPEPVTRQRLLANRQSRERRDVTDEGFEEILVAWEPPSADEHPIVLGFADDISGWLETHAKTLAAT